MAEETQKEEVKEISAPLPEEAKPEVKLPEMQHVIICLADGRRGVFAGPALISKGELALHPPKLVSIDFSEPRALGMIQPEEAKKEEPANENKGTEDQGNK